MKRLVLLIAGLVVSSTAMAEQVTISSGVNATIVGPFAAGDYEITPVAGAINVDNGAVSGCTGGADCSMGFAFDYTISSELTSGGDGPQLFSGTQLFATPELALAAAETEDFQPGFELAQVTFAVASCCLATTVGSLTIDFSLAGTFMGEIFDDIVPIAPFSGVSFLELSMVVDPPPEESGELQWWEGGLGGLLVDELQGRRYDPHLFEIPSKFGVTPPGGRPAVDPATPLERALIDQDQADMNDAIESVIPELQGIIVL